MQVIWSRATQVKLSCPCSSCLHTAVAPARRTTSAATRTRKVTVGDIFTACYSTILATAAVADARYKDRRRNDWDRAIAEVKAGKPVEDVSVPEPKGGGAHQGLNRKGNDEERDLNNIGYLRSNTWDQPHWPTPPAKKYRPEAERLGIRLRTLERELMTPLRIAPVAIKTLLLDPRSNVDSTDEDEFILQQHPSIYTPREPKTQVHLEKMEDVTRALVAQLLLRTTLHIPTYDAISTSSEAGKQRNEIAERIKEIQSGFFKSPSYKWIDGRSVSKERSELHTSLNKLCSKAAGARNTTFEIDILVGKICYNMLVCTAPPNVATYNILIKEFTRLKQYHLSQLVVDSFLGDRKGDSKIKPNERTVKLILDHYIAKRDKAGFKSVIRRMRADEGDMHIRRKLIYQLTDEPNVVKWALENRVMHRGAYLRQKVDRTSEIFESLVRGSLKMTGPRYPILFIRAALREGQMVFSHTIFRLVGYCLDAHDYKSGVKLLDAILSFWEDGTTAAAINYNSVVRFAIRKLLALCGIDPSSDLKQSLHPTLSQTALQSMLRHMHLESLSDSIQRQGKLIDTLRLAIQQAQDPKAEGLIVASITLRLAKKTKEWGLSKREFQRAEDRQIRVDGIEARLETQTKWIDFVAEEFDFTIKLYDQLSDKSKRAFVALCVVNTENRTHFSRIALLMQLKRKDEKMNELLEPRWHSVNGLQQSTEGEILIQKLILKAP